MLRENETGHVKILCDECGEEIRWYHQAIEAEGRDIHNKCVEVKTMSFRDIFKERDEHEGHSR